VQRGLEGGDLAARIRHARQPEHVDRDRPVGAPRHVRFVGRVGEFSPENLPECIAIELPADPSRVYQRVVDIPEHQRAGHLSDITSAAESARG
jgi:hypothetical protein